MKKLSARICPTHSIYETGQAAQLIVGYDPAAEEVLFFVNDKTRIQMKLLAEWKEPDEKGMSTEVLEMKRSGKDRRVDVVPLAQMLITYPERTGIADSNPELARSLDMLTDMIIEVRRKLIKEGIQDEDAIEIVLTLIEQSKTHK